METEKLKKFLADAIPLGEHPSPYEEMVRVRLDVLQECIDRLDWLEKGNAEWRGVALSNASQARAAQATARIAIGHLQAVLGKACSHHEQQAADTAARDWLLSIESEPT